MTELLWFIIIYDVKGFKFNSLQAIKDADAFHARFNDWHLLVFNSDTHN